METIITVHVVTHDALKTMLLTFGECVNLILLQTQIALYEWIPLPGSPLVVALLCEIIIKNHQLFSKWRFGFWYNL